MKTAWKAGSDLLDGHVVEPVGDALTDLVHSEPDHAFHIERVRVQHTPRGGDDLLLGVVPKGVAVVRIDLAEVDVEPHQVTALARDEQDVALVGGLDGGFEADVGKVGDGQHVDDAPGVVREVAARDGADRIPHAAARTVASDDVPGADDALRALADIAQRDHHRVLAVGLDFQGDEFQAVVGLEPGRRIAHVVEQVLLQPSLVDDEMREFRQAVLGVLNPSGAFDARAILLRRPPEHRLVHPMSLANDLLPQPESFQHLDGAAGDAVRVPDLERAVATLDQSRADVGEIRQLRCEQSAGRPAADDENVDCIGQLFLDDVGIARCVAIQVELHAVSFMRMLIISTLMISVEVHFRMLIGINP